MVSPKKTNRADGRAADEEWFEESVTFKAFAKINVTLHLTGRRPDGYHLLQSDILFCDLADCITLTVREGRGDECYFFGRFADCLNRDEIHSIAHNSILRILHELRQHVTLPVFTVGVEKNIPPQAGLGGGSADAAAILRLFSDRLAPDIAVQLAAKIGADGPACFLQKAGKMSGIGETFRTFDAPVFAESSVMLLWPGAGLATHEIYHATQLPEAAPDGQDNETEDFWQNLKRGRNDLTQAARKMLPDIDAMLDCLHQEGKKIQGFQFARMSGSGSAVFALFRGRKQAQMLAENLESQIPRHWWHWAGMVKT